MKLPGNKTSRLRRALFLLLFASSVARAGDDWPQFRGPAGNGVSQAKGLPTVISETENVRWKTAIHDSGWSSPVVWGDQIWLTTATEDGKQMYAVCVDLNTGGIRHDIKLWDVAEPQEKHAFNSYASPTPVIEAGRVYVHFGAHGTAALDTQTAKIIWQRRDIPCNHFRGPASSPIIVDDLLVLTFDGFDMQYVTALDKRTGKTVWKQDRNIDHDTDNGDFKKAYSTAQVIEVNGRRELVSPSAGATIAYDPTDGKELWRVRCGGINAAARPIYMHGLIYCTTAWQGWQLYAMKPGGEGDVTESLVVWKWERAVPQRSSPIIVDDLLFMVSDAGVLTCLDAKQGRLIRQKRLGGNYSASPVYADGKLYFLDEEGTATVIKADSDLTVLEKSQLESGVMASPAIVKDSLIVRTKTHLYRFQPGR